MFYGLTERQKRILSTPIDKTFIQTRHELNQTLSYISTPYVITYLDVLFDGCWSYKIVRAWSETSRIDLNNEIKDGKSIIHVLCELTYPLYPQKSYPDEVITDTSPIWVTKSGTGSHVGIGREKVQSQAYKAAMSDALKKAATLIGIGRELYIKPGAPTNYDFESWLRRVTDPEQWTPYDNMMNEKAFNYLDQYYQDKKWTPEQIEQKMNDFCVERNIMTLSPAYVDDYILWLDKQ